MDLGVNLRDAGVPDCDYQAVGETEAQVMDQARTHLSTEHEGLSNVDELLPVIQSLIGPIKT